MHFGTHIIDQNELGCRSVTSPTLFFMPHCPMGLYHNILLSNWNKSSLGNVYIFGNSFAAYDERLCRLEDRRRSLIVQSLPLVYEKGISLTSSEAQFAWTRDEQEMFLRALQVAFNDCKLHYCWTCNKTSNKLTEELYTCQRICGPIYRISFGSKYQ